MILRTMAYEEEKRLREECNSLLTVAKNLFTHLGELLSGSREVQETRISRSKLRKSESGSYGPRRRSLRFLESPVDSVTQFHGSPS